MISINSSNFKGTLLTKYFNEYANCGLCFRGCNIAKGKTGYCGTRYYNGEQLYSVIYGIISRLSIDAIEEKPFKHFNPGTYCLSFGSFGCNFRCKGCQNAEVSYGKQELPYLLEGNINKSLYIPPDIIVQIAKQLCCDGIAFTYNEPAVWLEYVLDAARIAKERGLYTVYVTNSTLTKESIDILAPYIDAIATDIKSLSNDFYKDICAANQVVNQVLEGIKYAQEKGIHIETRTNIIPGFNDDDDTIYKIANWIKDNLGYDSPWHVTKFYPTNDLVNIEETPVKTLEKACAVAKKIGLINVYSENKPCDCAVGKTSDKIQKMISKYRNNGILSNEDCINSQECCCCGFGGI